MPTGISIHIGLNAVDPDHYQGWSGPLKGCENDANDMAAIAKKQGFDPIHMLLTQEATSQALLDAIDDAAANLQSGDILFLTNSSHGGQVPDTNNDETDDEYDETWCTYDRQVIDDELYARWQRFRPGVRIVVLSDSCHSGTVLKLVPDFLNPAAVANVVEGAPDDKNELEGVMKAMREERAMAVYEANKDLYDRVQREAGPSETADVGASIILISGCQDNQTSADGAKNGLFTETLLEVWNAGKFKGGYRPFWRQIVKAMPLWQSPNFMRVGAQNPAFLKQNPFSV
jgi:metacaspase-1